MPDSFRSKRPSNSECPEFYHGYLEQVPAGNIIDILENQRREIQSLLTEIEEDRGTFRYAPEKWSIKEIVGHLADGERVFGYRVLRFSRDDQTELPGFEQDDYVRNASFDTRQMDDLATELDFLRRANLGLFGSLTEADFEKVGFGNGASFTVRSQLHIIAGHMFHHIRIMRENYLMK